MTSESLSAGARQFERHSTQFEARLEAHPDHADQFRLSFTATGSALPVVDVSGGGLALRTTFFLPRNMRFKLIITGGDDPGAGELSVKAIVRRCITIDHKPTFQVGMQFLDPSGEHEQKLVQRVVASQIIHKKPEAKREPASVS